MAKRNHKRREWFTVLIDRALYALASAGIAALIAWLQGRAEVKELKRDNADLEWAVDYYRR